MNDQAVEALREAMEPPTWWTNRARLSAREVLQRLEERGFTVAALADRRPAAEPASNGATPEGATNGSGQGGNLGRLMTRLDASVATAREAAAPAPSADAQPAKPSVAEQTAHDDAQEERRTA